MQAPYEHSKNCSIASGCGELEGSLEGDRQAACRRSSVSDPMPSETDPSVSSHLGITLSHVPSTSSLRPFWLEIRSSSSRRRKPHSQQKG